MCLIGLLSRPDKWKRRLLSKNNNGSNWDPLPWVVPVVWRKDPERAKQMVNDAIDFFRANGIHDSVNEDYILEVPDYVTSATNLYAASRWISRRR